MKLETTKAFKDLSKYNSDLIVLSEDQLKEIHKIELEAVHDIISICDEFDINYHLTGGSALGVVRHNGFIPWDDDVDIDMARKDIALFFLKFREKYGDKYWIHTPYSENKFCIQCYHIRRKDTIFRGCADAISEQAGICIDVLAIENTYNNRILRVIHGFGSMILGFIVSCNRFYMNRKYLLKLAKENKEIYEIFKKKIGIGFFFSFLSLRRWTILLDKWNSICRNEHSVYVTVPTGKNHFFKEIYLREKFYRTTKGKFEDITVKIPYDIDDYLTHMFNDYFVIPSESEREQHVLVEYDVNIK